MKKNFEDHLKAMLFQTISTCLCIICIYSLFFNVSAAGLYQETETFSHYFPIFTELSTWFAQNDQPVIHRGGGWMTSYTTCFARKVIMMSQANTPKLQRRTARFV